MGQTELTMEFTAIEEGNRAVAYIPIESHMCSLELIATGKEAQTVTKTFWHSGDFYAYRIEYDPNEEGEIPNKGTCLLFVPKDNEVYVFNEVLYYRVRVGNEFYMMCHSFTDGNANEKRMYGRINVNARARVMMGQVGAVAAIIDDISNTGLSIHLPHTYEMELGGRAIILLDDEDVTECLMISGEIVRKNLRGNDFYYGINVEDPGDRDNASTFIFRRLEQQVRLDHKEEELIQVKSLSPEVTEFERIQDELWGSSSLKKPESEQEPEKERTLLDDLLEEPLKVEKKPLVVWDDEEDVKIVTW